MSDTKITTAIWACFDGEYMFATFQNKDLADEAIREHGGVAVPFYRHETPSAWLHPTANWSHVKYEFVSMHCGKDGPLPVPLYAALTAPEGRS